MSSRIFIIFPLNTHAHAHIHTSFFLTNPFSHVHTPLPTLQRFEKKKISRSRTEETFEPFRGRISSCSSLPHHENLSRYRTVLITVHLIRRNLLYIADRINTITRYRAVHTRRFFILAVVLPHFHYRYLSFIVTLIVI